MQSVLVVPPLLSLASSHAELMGPLQKQLYRRDWDHDLLCVCEI